MYDLPSGEADVSGTLIDLIDDEDLEMMWEEMDFMLVSRAESSRGLLSSLEVKQCSKGQAVH